jgi:hypothetical protein
MTFRHSMAGCGAFFWSSLLSTSRLFNFLRPEHQRAASALSIVVTRSRGSTLRRERPAPPSNKYLGVSDDFPAINQLFLLIDNQTTVRCSMQMPPRGNCPDAAKSFRVIDTERSRRLLPQGQKFQRTCKVGM